MEFQEDRQSKYWRAALTKTVMVMKITAILMLIACLHVSARGVAQERISLDLKGVTLKTVLEDIRRQTGYQYIFIYNWTGDAKNITVSMHDAPLQQVLDFCFRDLPLSYSIEDSAIVIKKKALPQSNLADPGSPPSVVHGRITDSTGTPLTGAIVQVAGTGKSATTDDNGDFVMKEVDGSATLVVSFIGYGTQRVELKGRKEIAVSLHVTNVQLAKVTVDYNTGYQSLPKERATGSFAVVNNELFNKQVSTDVLSRLEGNVPGLLVNKNTLSASTGNVDINIQGHSTLFSNDQPLIVVDNFAYDGNVNNINPNDIESITVLKDAAAASIWGVRSGNGVIVITTKKGRRNQKLQTEFNANVTVGEKPDLKYNPNFLNSNDYINIEQMLYAQGYYTSTLLKPYNIVSPVVQILANESKGTISTADATSQINSLRAVDVRDDLSKYFYQRQITKQYNVNLRGGGERSDYIFSVGYDNNLANAVGNKNYRITINSGINFYPIKNLQISTNVNYVQNFAQTNSPLGNLSSLYPYTQLADSKGSPLAITQGYASAYKDSLTNLGYMNWQYKPLAEIGLADNTNRLTDNKLNFGAKYTFFPGLNLDVAYQNERSTGLAQNYYSDSTYNARNVINRYTKYSAGSFTYNIPVGGILQQSNSELNSNQARAQLNFTHNWNRVHDLIAIAGTEIRQAINQSNSNTVYGYDNSTEVSATNINYGTYYPTLPTGSSLIPNTLAFGKTTSNFISYFSNAAYSFRERYTFSASGRIDHSNLFGVSTNQKAVPLFSTGLAWDVNREGFYHVFWLPYLKLRATYGYNANINTSAAAVTTISQYPNAPYTGYNFANITSPGNPDLQWEKIRKVNFGTDFALMRNIIMASFDYYLKKGINLFGSSSLPPSVGQTSFFGNTGSTLGHGFDLVLNSKNINNKIFKWTTNFQLSHAFDKVTKYEVKATSASLLGNGSGNNGNGVVPIVGRPIFGIYSYKAGPLTHDTGDPQGYVGGKLSTDYATIVSTGTPDSLHYNGPSRPTYFGSLRNTIAFKQLSLSFNIIYKFDYYFVRSSMSDVSAIASGLPGNKDYDNRWQKPGDELHTNIPSMGYPPFNSNRGSFYQNSSALVDNGNNIRLKDVTLDYDLDKSVIKALPFTHLQLYLYLNNVGILWRANKDKLDPDVFSSAGAYPTPRTLSFGIKANF
jgi:TonB-linked SusC/RagA family outer membrane protein